MGQKVHPFGLRVGISEKWISNWIASSREEQVNNVVEDNNIRKFITSRYRLSGISKIEISRFASRIDVIIYTSQPGVIIGRKGTEIKLLEEEIRNNVLKSSDKELNVSVIEIKRPDTDAQIVAENIAKQIEMRIPYKRAMRRALQKAVDLGVKGIRIRCSGRLGGVDVARSEELKFGTIPLSTLTAKVKYGFAEANSTVGIVGVKVWIYE
ncbi:MAG: 30S ribosomal protein S3 [Spirochaetia bacterium]|nr:30S ribosomal protein S3 [Spirochaetota bacterium]MCX8097315.1 30S ribosomal protein S3 [Spirochaetota bacterium]MDW8112836.1 30S ribosomal protein S3 [Spirochaetia bacterium]